MDDPTSLFVLLIIGLVVLVAVGFALSQGYRITHIIEFHRNNSSEPVIVESQTSNTPSTDTIATEPTPPLEITISRDESSSNQVINESPLSVFPSIVTIPVELTPSAESTFESDNSQPNVESASEVFEETLDVPASGHSTESSIKNEELIESDNLTGTATINTTPVTPLPRPKVESDAQETPKPLLPEILPTPNPQTYHPPTPPSPRRQASDTRERTPHSMQRADADLRLRVQLVFGRGGAVNTLALVPDRREGMAREVDITGTQGELRLMEQSNDCYEPVPFLDASSALREGIDWQGRGDARRWRWVLRGRELYVLASGDVSGLYPFGSTPRLCLNARHVVLSTTRLREEVLAALMDAGCTTPEVNDDYTPGVPSGWILFRNVTPTRAVPMREDADILNALCPAHEIKPHFVGGIRLKGNTWLAGFPPRIRFTGELGDGFQVMIDGELAQPAIDNAFEAPGWDAEGEHRLWFAGRTETYSLRTMDEGWDRWNAHDFGTGAAICGAGIHRIDGARWHQVRVSATNLLLLGARPGEIFKCQERHGVRSETVLALIPFAPVWALPVDSVHANKRSTRLVLLDSIEPTSTAKHSSRDQNTNRTLREWAAAINDAGRKQLALADTSEGTRALWRRYRAVAKRLWKRIR